MSARAKAKYDKEGFEILDETPMQPPLNYKRPPTLSEQIRQQVIAHKLELLEQMEETEEEADDFEVGEDFEPASKYENDNTPTIAELKQRARDINDKIAKRRLAAAKKVFEAEQEKLATERRAKRAAKNTPVDPA